MEISIGLKIALTGFFFLMLSGFIIKNSNEEVSDYIKAVLSSIFLLSLATTIGGILTLIWA